MSPLADTKLTVRSVTGWPFRVTLPSIVPVDGPHPARANAATAANRQAARRAGLMRVMGIGVGLGKRSRRGSAPDRKSTRLNSSHANISYAVFCLKKKKNRQVAETSLHPTML